jgi:hypothetical protein
MLTLLITSICPVKLEDGDLQNHIARLLLTLESIRIEMVDCWNHPAKQNVMPRLRQQLAETTSSLDAALYVYNYRLESMR